jgi:hypothetical protein
MFGPLQYSIMKIRQYYLELSSLVLVNEILFVLMTG